MADYNPSLSMGVNSPDPQAGLNTLNKIMDLGSKGLQIRGQQFQNQSLQADAQLQQQTMKERQLLQQTMKSGVRPDTGTSLYNDNNELDPDKLMDFANKNLPMIGQGVTQSILKTRADKNALASSVADLTDKYKNDLSGIARSFVNNPQAKADDVNQAFQRYAKLNPDAAPTVLAASNLVKHLDNAPDMKDKNNQLIHLSWELQPASRTAEQQAPSVAAIGTGGAVKLTQTNPNAPGGVAGVGTLPVTIPPGYTMVNGQLVRADNAGLSLPPLRGSGTPGTLGQAGAQAKLQAYPQPPINADPGVVQRYRDQMAANQKHVQDVSDSANDTQNGVGAARYRNDQLKMLLQREIANNKPNVTGPGADSLHWIASHTPFMGQFTSDYDTIKHYLAQNSASMAQKMGVPSTNAGAETAAAGAGSTAQTPKALLEVTKQNDAMNTAYDMYNRGLAKVSNYGADPTRVSAFKQAFGQNFDTNVYRYDDAIRSNDRAEIDNLRAKLGPKGLQALAAKRKILHSLSDTGDLP